MQSEFKPGDEVEHDRYGPAVVFTVAKISRSGVRCRAGRLEILASPDNLRLAARKLNREVQQVVEGARVTLSMLGRNAEGVVEEVYEDDDGKRMRVAFDEGRTTLDLPEQLFSLVTTEAP